MSRKHCRMNSHILAIYPTYNQIRSVLMLSPPDCYISFSLSILLSLSQKFLTELCRVCSLSLFLHFIYCSNSIATLKVFLVQLRKVKVVLKILSFPICRLILICWRGHNTQCIQQYFLHIFICCYTHAFMYQFPSLNFWQVRTNIA